MARKKKPAPPAKKKAVDKFKPDPKSAAPSKALAAAKKKDAAPLSAEEALAVLVDVERKEPERIAAAERLGALKHTAAIDRMFDVREASEAYLARAIAAALLAMGAGPIVVAGLQSGDPKERVRAAGRLLRLGDPGTEAAIQAGMKDPEPRVRRTLVEALARMDTESARTAIDAALRDRDADVRAVAAAAVGKRGGASAAATLKAMLESETDDVAREFIERALVKLGAKGATA